MPQNSTKIADMMASASVALRSVLTLRKKGTSRPAFSSLPRSFVASSRAASFSARWRPPAPRVRCWRARAAARTATPGMITLMPADLVENERPCSRTRRPFSLGLDSSTLPTVADRREKARASWRRRRRGRWSQTTGKKRRPCFSPDGAAPPGCTRPPAPSRRSSGCRAAPAPSSWWRRRRGSRGG